MSGLDEEMFQRLYAGCVFKRMSELEFSNEDVQKRWVWELIQNAKDCLKEAKDFIPNNSKIPFQKSYKSVDIKIIYDESEQIVIFKHNGFPFTQKTLNSLMYTVSSKTSKEDSTGRYGTGFMASHTLSRVVPICGPFLLKKDDELEMHYFNAVIYREGNKDQLVREFLKMTKSKQITDFDPNNEEHNWTTYTYKLVDDTAIKSAKLGIQSFREYIVEVLMFCSEINSIQLNDEDPITLSSISKSKSLTQSLTDQNVFSNVQITEKTIKYPEERKFIVASVEEPNEQFSKKFAKEHEKDYELKDLKLTIAFEISKNHKIVDIKKDQVCLFCTFPLIGSQKFQLPYLLHCHYLETTIEREGIVLGEKEFDNDGTISNSGLNTLIINYSVQLFKIIVQWLIQNKFTNYASFSNGLINDAVYDDDTLKLVKPFLNNLRSVLEDSKIVCNSEKVPIMLKESIILDFNGVKNAEGFHDLASILYSNVASFDDCKQWQGKTWDKISVLNFDTFINHIHHIGQKVDFKPIGHFSSYQLSDKLFTNGINKLEKQDFAFLNQLYAFILDEESEDSGNDKVKDDSMFYKYKIVFNLDNNFTILRNLKSDSECSNDFKQLMELCPLWKSKIVHPKIKSLKSIIPKISINDALQEINSVLEKEEGNVEFSLSFVRFVLSKNKYRMKMYQVAKLFYDVPEQIVLTDVDEKLWSSTDSLILDRIKQTIDSKKGQKFTKSLDTLNLFYELYQKFNSSSNFLVPNYNLLLTERKKLGLISSEIDQVLLDTLGEYIDLSQYAHPSITEVHFQHVYNLDALIQSINSYDFFKTQKGIIDENRLLAVLSIMPPKSNQRLFNYQTSIRELAKLFFCKDIKLIQTNIVNELFWKKVNEIVLDEIEKSLTQHGNIQTLSELLVKDEEIIFNILNLYYELLTTDNSDRQDKALVPNYKGSFVPATEISISKGVSEELFELYNVIQRETDIREKYAHPNVKCNFLRIIDFKQFISSICEGLSDKQLIEDNEILQAISKLNIAQPNNNANENENEILLQKLYVANIKNRLNEIQNPKENDKMRWPWELIQNAKDSLFSPSNVKDQKKVEIRIEVKTDKRTHECTEIRFRHNGPPFTDDSFIGLLYKISQGKDNSKTTGRFGTGFISTHVLSKIVRINVNRVNKAGDVYGFTATMFREGIKDADIVEDFKKMQKSHRLIEHQWQYNEFIYEISSEESKECVKLGLDHLKAHIAPALINCPEIERIIIAEDKNETRYFLDEKKNLKIHDIKYSSCIISEGKEKRELISIKNKERNLNISIEIKDKKIVKMGDKDESIFVSLPLVGSYSHALPFYINSPKFEPVTERNALYLDGKEKIKDKLLNTGINRSFLMKSIDLFRDLIIILNDMNCTNTYELSRGLNLTHLHYCDFEWYKLHFLKDMREILASNLYVNTPEGKTILLKDACFPSHKIEDKHLDQFINLSSKYFKNIVNLEDAMIWQNRAWEELSIVEIDDLIHKVEEDRSLFDEPEYTYLNEFLGFIKNLDIGILYKHRLIPDMNNELHCLDKEAESFDFKESRTVEGQIIDIMESIGIKWRSTHMNYKIISISLPEDKLIDAESRIVERIAKNKELSFEMMKYVLEGNEFRENMYYFVTKLKIRNYKAITVVDIKPGIWRSADKHVINYIVELIQTYQPNQVESLMEFFIKFLPVYKNYQKDENEFNSTKIFPNAKYSLRTLNELRKKVDSFHDHLNPIMIQYYAKDLDENILHPSLNKITKPKYDESLSDILDIINKNIRSLDQNVQLIIAEKVVCMVPNEKISFYASTRKLEPSAQQQIYDLYHEFINQGLEKVLIAQKFFNKFSWNKSNSIIIEFICNRIQEQGNMSNFKKAFSNKSDNECYRYLNTLYKYSNDFVDKYKVIPNKKGVFKLIGELKEDPGIENDLLQCIDYLNPESLLRYDFVDNRVKVDGLSKIPAMVFYRNLQQMFTEALKKPDVDEKVIDMIKQINHIDDSFLDVITTKKMDEDQKARITILQNAHVQFISNRLREFKAPKLKDFKRWPFELIQNANDSLFTTKSKSNPKVTIEFEFIKDKVIFRHNGPPFTNESLFALVYQCSEGKGKDSRTTGKFGTGFLSTHILSKTVNFTGDVQTKDGVSGFKVTIYRDGNSKEELIEGVTKMERSLKKGLDPFNFTTFEYILSNDKNAKDAYEYGLTSLKNNVGPVLINNETIESISIKTEKETLLYSANHEEGNIQTISIMKESGSRNSQWTEKYIFFNNNVKYDESNDIEINCLLPISSKNEIMKAPFDVLFISYPLFDNEQFYSPILINSSRFEPVVERNKLMIQAEESPDESKESLINKFILAKAVDLFEQIVSFALKMKCSRFYNLCSGLKTNNKTPIFLKEKFYEEMRKKLLNFPVFETSSGLRTVNDVLLPSIESYDVFTKYNKNDKRANDIKKMYFKKFYNLVSRVSIESKLVVEYELCLQWLMYSSWISFPSQIEIEAFILFISSHQKVSDIPLIKGSRFFDDDDDDYISISISNDSNNNDNNNNNNNNDNNNNNNNDNNNNNNNDNNNNNNNDNEGGDDDDMYISLNLNKSIRNDPKVMFIKKFIMFIEKMRECARLFKENKLLINAKGNFVSSDDIHHFHLPPILVEMLDIVEYDYREKTLHSEIHHLYNNKNLTFEKFKAKQAIEIIKDNIKESNAISFMKYVIEDDEKRSSMFRYTNFFLDKSMESVQIPKTKEYIEDLKGMLKEADKFVVPKIIKKLEYLDIQNNLQFFIDLFNFLKSILSYQDFSSLKIYPNQRYALCPIYSLANDGIRNDDIKNVLQRVLAIDLRRELLLNEFTDNAIRGRITKSSLSHRILASLQHASFNALDKDTRFEFYSIIFKYSATKENKEKIEQMMSILNFFLQFNIVQIDDDDSADKWSNDLLNKVFEFAAKDATSYVARFRTIDKLKERIVYNEEKDNEFSKLIYDNLSYLYNFSTEGRIFPTLTRELVGLNDIHWLHDSQLNDDEMMDNLLGFLTDFVQSDEIKEHILSDSINVYEKLKGLIQVYDLNFISKTIIDNILGREDKETPKFQELFIRFLKYVNTSNELKIVFNSLIEGEMKNKMDDFLDFLEYTQEERESGYTGEALVYETLIESGKFSVVNWNAKSDDETEFSVTLQNGNRYYIKEHGDPYDIYVEDMHGNKYYIEVKSTKSGKEDSKKLSFNLSTSQFDFASQIGARKEHFVLALVRNVFDSPQILFLTRQNNTFTI